MDVVNNFSKSNRVFGYKPSQSDKYRIYLYQIIIELIILFEKIYIFIKSVNIS